MKHLYDELKGLGWNDELLAAVEASTNFVNSRMPQLDQASELFFYSSQEPLMTSEFTIDDLASDVSPDISL